MITNGNIFENGEFELSVIDYLNEHKHDYWGNILKYVCDKYGGDYDYKLSTKISSILAKYSKNRKEESVISINGKDIIVQIEQLTDFKSGLSTAHMITCCEQYIGVDSIMLLDDTDNKELCILFYNDTSNDILLYLKPDIFGLKGKNILIETYNISELYSYLELDDEGYMLGVKFDVLDEDYIIIDENVGLKIPLFKQNCGERNYSTPNSIMLQQFINGKNNFTITHFGYKSPY